MWIWLWCCTKECMICQVDSFLPCWIRVRAVSWRCNNRECLRWWRCIGQWHCSGRWSIDKGWWEWREWLEYGLGPSTDSWIMIARTTNNEIVSVELTRKSGMKEAIPAFGEQTNGFLWCGYCVVWIFGSSKMSFAWSWCRKRATQTFMYSKSSQVKEKRKYSRQFWNGLRILKPATCKIFQFLDEVGFNGPILQTNRVYYKEAFK